MAIDIARKALEDSNRYLKAAAGAFGQLLRAELNKPGTGRFYKVRKGAGYKNVKVKVAGPLQKGEERSSVAEQRRDLTKFHRASVAGQPPAPDTRTLQRSVYVEKSGALSYNVGVSAAHSRPLEYGTANVKARPFMRPTLARFQALGLNVVAGKLKWH